MIAMARRGGRARLKASDSKSDRGVSPSGVQILSPPPIFLMERGEVTERPKVRHWKCRIRVTVSRVRIPPSPPSNGVSGMRRRISDMDVAVLDGEVAVPCSPQSALAGLNPLPRTFRVE